MGHDDEVGNQTILPLGGSLWKLLTHPADQTEEFRLLRGNLEETTAGLVLVKQSEKEAREEKRALVLVAGCHDESLGTTKIYTAYDHTSPDPITYTQGDGCKHALFIFRPGDGLFISWPAEALGSTRPKSFIVSWDGTEMKERVVNRNPRRPRRPWKKPVEEPRETKTSVSEVRPLRQLEA
jgi:hypothetical protein